MVGCLTNLKTLRGAKGWDQRNKDTLKRCVSPVEKDNALLSDEDGHVAINRAAALQQGPSLTVEPIPEPTPSPPAGVNDPYAFPTSASPSNLTSLTKRLASHQAYSPSSSSNTSVDSSGDNNAGSTTTKSPRDALKDERRIKASRKTLDHFLRKISSSSLSSRSRGRQTQQRQGRETHGIKGVTRSLVLNEETGICSFPYHRFLVVVEIPQDQPKTVYVYTCVSRLEEHLDNISQVALTAMELNYLQAGTCGSTLGMMRNSQNHHTSSSTVEVNLCRSIPLKALNATKLMRLLDEFLATAFYAHAKLERAKRSYLDVSGSASSEDVVRIGSPRRITTRSRHLHPDVRNRVMTT